MKPFVIAAAVLGTALAAVSLPADPAAAAPPGSYRETCRRVRDVGTGRDPILAAQCRDERGRWRDTTLAYRGCRGDVVNDGGRLACARGGGGGGRPDRPGGGWDDRPDRPDRPGRPGTGWGGGNPGRPQPLPAGSWRRSCEPREWSGGVLTARCENGNRGREISRLDLRSCRSGRAGNSYGRLACE